MVRQIQSHIGLRGCAALLVVFYHNQFLPNRLPFEEGTAFFLRGYLMVDLFFMLSGLIMSHVYGKISATPSEYFKYIWRRVARIYPIHVVCLAFLLIIKFFIIFLYIIDGQNPEPFWRAPGTWEAFLAQLLLIHSFLPSEPGWNIPSWSISAELFAYLVFPFAAVFIRRKVGFAVVIFGIMVTGYYSTIALTTQSLDVTYGSAPLRCLAGFLLGMLIYRYGKPMGQNPFIASAFQLLALVAIGVWLAQVVNDVYLIAPFAILVAATMGDRGIVSQLMSQRPFQFLGEISYSVYLLHVPLIALLYPLFLAASKRIGLDLMSERAVWLLFITASVLILSTITYRMIEMPARTWLTNITFRHRRAFT